MYPYFFIFTKKLNKTHRLFIEKITAYQLFLQPYNIHNNLFFFPVVDSGRNKGNSRKRGNSCLEKSDGNASNSRRRPEGSR